MKLAIDFPVPLEIHQDQQFLHVPPEVGAGLDDFRRDEVPPVMLYIQHGKTLAFSNFEMAFNGCSAAQVLKDQEVLKVLFYRFWL